jgi:hypothetical protein
MSESKERSRKEVFFHCPNNPGVLVGNYGTIKDINTGEVLEQKLSKKGYFMVKNPCKSVKNPRKYELVHRLVALTYMPGYSRLCWVCHHIDHNPRNNISKNLLWVSKQAHEELHRDRRRKAT